jgi:hypothetical protein
MEDKKARLIFSVGLIFAHRFCDKNHWNASFVALTFGQQKSTTFAEKKREMKCNEGDGKVECPQFSN